MNENEILDKLYDLRNEIESLKSKVDGEPYEDSGLRGRIRDLESENEGLRGTVRDLEKRVEALEDDGDDW